MMTTTANQCGAKVREAQSGAPRARKLCVEMGVSLADVRFAAMHAWHRANATWTIRDAEMRALQCAACWQEERERWPNGLDQAIGEEDVCELAAEWVATWNTLYEQLSPRPLH